MLDVVERLSLGRVPDAIVGHANELVASEGAHACEDGGALSGGAPGSGPGVSVVSGWWGCLEAQRRRVRSKAWCRSDEVAASFGV